MPQIFLLAGTTTWTVPDDCVSANIDTIGAGAGGDAVGGAGGGGGWSNIVGLALTPRAIITVQIGAGGASGSAGGDTWFNGASLGAASVGAKGGGAPTTMTGGTGGAAASRPNTGGTTGNSGGNGGSVATGNPGGGGGAAGLASNGGSGANGGVSLGGSGGNGDNGLSGGGIGGLGSAAGTNPGNPGTEYDASHGSGGGGGGSVTNTGGAGGNYGGGGGGSLVTGGAGAAGLIVINYVSVFVNKRPPAHFLQSYDDASIWQASQTPKAFNLSLATANVFAKTVLRPPFYVPRPSDDFIWQGTPDGYNSNVLDDLSRTKFFGVPGQVPTKLWGPIYNYDVADSALWYPTPENRDSDVLPLLTAVKFFGALGQAPTKRWNLFYNYDVAESVWQPTIYHNNNLVSITEPIVNLPWLWKFSQDDGPTWQGPSENYNSLTLDLLTNTKFFGVPGQVPTKRWRYDFDINDVAWPQSNAVSSATFYTLLSVAQNPFKQHPWLFGYSDDSTWQGPLENYNSGAIQLTTTQAKFFGVPGQVPTKQWHSDYDSGETFWIWSSPAALIPRLPAVSTVVQPPFVVPRPGDDAYWQFASSPNLNLTSSPPAATPFAPFLWKFSQDDSSGWQGAPYSSPLIVPLLVKKPFIYEPWTFGQDDSSGWQSGSKGRNRNLITVVEPFINIPWKFGYSESPDWQFDAPYNLAIVSNLQFPTVQDTFENVPDDAPGWQYKVSKKNFNLVSVTAPFASIPWLWKFSQDDTSHWQGKSLASVLLIPELITKPFIYTPWQGGNEDPSGWQSGSKTRNLNLVTIIEPTINLPWLWKFSQDDASGWQGQAISSKLLIPELTKQPFTYYPWKFGQDDSSGWGFSSYGRNPNLVTIIEPVVNLPWQWKFNYDEPSNWQGQPSASKLLIPTLTVGSQPPTKRWLTAYTFDDSSGWQSGSKGRNPNLVSVVEPFANLPWLWKFSQDDSSGWQFSSKGSALLVPIATAGGQTSAPAWKFATRPFDDPFWQFRGQLNINVTNTPKINVPTALNWVHGTPPQDAPPWQSLFWRNTTILFPIPVSIPLVTDPRFVSSPIQRTLVNTPTRRQFVTTPKSRFPSMPYGNDFSVIDPTVEQVTTTFNFDPWLALGETVTAILAITVTNSKFTLSQDPNPQAIIFGVPQIGPVPPQFPGIPPGTPNRAVLQQVANCQPGVIYLLQCLVMTSNNQKLNLASHLACATLN